MFEADAKEAGESRCAAFDRLGELEGGFSGGMVEGEIEEIAGNDFGSSESESAFENKRHGNDRTKADRNHEKSAALEKTDQSVKHEGKGLARVGHGVKRERFEVGSGRVWRWQNKWSVNWVVEKFGFGANVKYKDLTLNDPKGWGSGFGEDGFLRAAEGGDPEFETEVVEVGGDVGHDPEAGDGEDNQEGEGTNDGAGEPFFDAGMGRINFFGHGHEVEGGGGIDLFGRFGGIIEGQTAEDSSFLVGWIFSFNFFPFFINKANDCGVIA
jgi:hypothetical protein